MIEIAAAHMLAASLALSAAGLDDRHSAQDLTCLALNVYFEARSEGAEGQAAVAHVTLNRVRDPAYPDTICGVVTQSNGGSCQFGWWCDGRTDAPSNAAQYQRAMRAAVNALAGRSQDPTGGATYFLASRDGTPGWARRLTQTATIEGHRFFKR